MLRAFDGAVAALLLVCALWVALLPVPEATTPSALPAIPAHLGPLTAEQRFLVRSAIRESVPPVVALEMAWEETRRNTHPLIRGAHGEWGRFQIKPLHCDGRVKTYSQNVACYFRLMRSHEIACGGWVCAIERYNGRGPRARAYRDRVLARIGARSLGT